MLSRLKIVPLLSIPGRRLILDKVYDVRPLDPEKYKNNHFLLNNREFWWEVYDNDGIIGIYSRNYFETEQEIRDNKLNELGI